MKLLESAEGEPNEALLKVAQNLTEIASGDAKDRVAAFEALRDTLDGKPESEGDPTGNTLVVELVYPNGGTLKFDE